MIESYKELSNIGKGHQETRNLSFPPPFRSYLRISRRIALARKRSSVVSIIFV